MARTGNTFDEEEIVAIGELADAIDNTAIFKDNTGSIQGAALGASGTVLTSNGPTSDPTFQVNAGGDVTGPGSSTDNAFARFDLTTGKLLQNGLVGADDSGNVTGINDLTAVGVTIANTTTNDGIFLNQDGNGIALNIDSESTTALAVINIVTEATTGRGIRLISNGIHTNQVMDLFGTNASATGQMLRITNPGTGDSIFINQDGNGRSIDIDTEATTANGINIAADVMTSGTIGVFSTNSSSFSGTAMNVIVDNTGATGTALRVQQDGTGDIINCFDGATEVFTLLDGGNLGLMTSTPGALLEMNAGSNDGVLLNNGTVIGFVFNIGNTSMGVGTSSNQPLSLFTNNTAKVTVEADGDVVIGATSSAGARLDVRKAGSIQLQLSEDGEPKFSFQVTGTEGRMEMASGSSESTFITFRTSNAGTEAEHMRIEAAGNIGIGTTSAGAALDIDKGEDSLVLRADRAGTTITSSIAEFVSDVTSSNTVHCKILADGDIENTNNSYGAISDVKLKENIVDCTPKLADLMNVRIRHYTFKSGHDGTQLGVIAQELETVFPGLIRTSPDYERIPDPDWTPRPAISEVTQEVEVTPETTEEKQMTQTVQRQITTKEIVFENDKYIEKEVTIIKDIEELLWDQVTLYDEDDNEIGTHTIPRMETVTIPSVTKTEIVTHAKDEQKESDRPIIEKRIENEETKSVKYSIFTPMLIKGVQEIKDIIDSQQVQIDTLKTRIVALEGA